MIDPTKRTSGARWRVRAIQIALSAAVLIAAAPGGRAPREHTPRVQVAVATDSAAPRIRILDAASRQIVLGRVDPGGTAARDELTLVSDSPCDIRLRLTPTLPGTELEFSVCGHGGRDWKKCVVGPDGIARAEFDAPTEGERLDLVIRSEWGSSSYGLEIETGPRTAAKSASDRR